MQLNFTDDASDKLRYNKIYELIQCVEANSFINCVNFTATPGCSKSMQFVVKCSESHKFHEIEDFLHEKEYADFSESQQISSGGDDDGDDDKQTSEADGN